MIKRIFKSLTIPIFLVLIVPFINITALLFLFKWIITGRSIDLEKNYITDYFKWMDS